MTALTLDQQQYLRDRLHTIKRDKLAAKRTELFGEGGPQQPTWGMVFAAIKAGEIVLKEGTESLTRAYLMPTDVEWPARAAKLKQLEDYQAMLTLEQQRITDSFMLGDAADCLSKFAAI